MTDHRASRAVEVKRGGETDGQHDWVNRGAIVFGVILIVLAASGTASLAQSCSSAPGDVIDLQFAADGMTMTFTEPLVTGGGVPFFDMLRADGPTLFGSTAVCVESNEVDNAAVDGANPALGQMFVYIPRAENDCGLGVMGYDDAGVERPQGIQCGLCLTDATCDDGLYCTGNEICDAAGGACRPGTPPACAPFACDEGAGACVMSCADDAECAGGFGCHQGSCVEAIDVTVMDDGRDADPGDGICDTGSRECTLRAAIQEANARAGLQIVRLQKGAYLLTLNGMSDDEGLSGDFDLLDDVIVRGVDSARTWVDGQTVDRLFHVHPGVDATLQNLTVQQGRVTGSNGGGVLNEGMLTLRSAMVNACATDLRGGGIYNADGAMLTLDGSTVAFSNAGDDGGGVANDGDMTAMVSTLSSNTAGDRGGALQVGPRAWAELINVTVYNNTAVMGGGLDPGAGTLQMVNTVVAGSIMGGDCAAPPLSLGHNLAGDLSCDLTETGDVQETDPQLTDLLVYTDSGIRTHYPSFESPGPNPTQGTGDATFIPQLDQNHQNWTEAGSTFKRSVVQLPLIDALASGRVYVRDSHQIRIFETLGHTQVGSIPGFVAGGHFVMHPSGTRMFMLNDDRLDFVDLDTGTITVGLPLVLPFGLAINPSGTRLFVPQFHSGASHITVVDTATLQSISSYTSQGTYIGQFPAVNKIGTALLTPTGAESVGLASPLAFTANEQLQPLATQSWPATWWPHAVRPGPGATFFTIDHHLNNPPDLQDIDSRLSFLQSSAAAPITVLTIPNAYATWCVVDPTGSRVYVNADDDLLVVDTLAAQLVTTVSGVGYGEVEIHPLEGAVYAANFTHGFSVISTTTFQVTTMYPDINDFGGLAVKP